MALNKNHVNTLGTDCASAEARFLKLISALPKVSVQGYDKERRVIYWNASSEDIYGYTQEEALGKRLENLIIPTIMRDEVVSS